MIERRNEPGSESDKGTATPARVQVPSQAEQVTFFEDRAEVKRRARAQVKPGLGWVVVGDVSSAVDDSTVIVGARGERARTIANRVVRRVREETAISAIQIAQLEKEFEAVRAKRRRLEATIARIQSERNRQGTLARHWLTQVARVPRDAATTAPGSRLAYSAIEQAEMRSLDDEHARKSELNQARLDEQLLATKLAEGRTLVPRYEATVEVQVEALEPHEVELELTYRVPCALWRPEHLAKLETTADGKMQLRLRTWASVWQLTGERWENITCRFSTARPARDANAPLVSDDQLYTRRKSAEERKTVVVEARDQNIALAGLERGARELEEMPGVDDGGEPLTYTAPRPTTIPSDGHAFRVELEELVLPTDVDVVAYPERSEAAFVRALATLKRPTPLLAGPVWVARGTELVGRAKSTYVAAGEPFELGFGTDDGIRVRRQLTETKDTTAITGTQKSMRKVQVFLSNLSGSIKKVTVIERVPVSEIGDVKVEVTEAEGSRPERKDGLIKYDVELAPRATKTLTLVYRIEASSKVRMSF